MFLNNYPGNFTPTNNKKFNPGSPNKPQMTAKLTPQFFESKNSSIKGPMYASDSSI